ncbi:MAG: DUF1963 domain-containing protein [Actinobacteria bacterium]|nr:DUF1963 domain-containing protein [Actinomycetota bacterium]
MTDFDADLHAFSQRLAAAGLGRFANALIQMTRSSIRLIADRTVPTETMNTSRLGGMPDLPATTHWPTNDGKPLSFIAQVNLAEVAPYDLEAVLPKDGLLSFFYEAVAQPWGFDPADHGSAAVLYTPPNAGTERRSHPAGLTSEGVFPSIGLRSRAELTFAPWESFVVEALGMSRDEGFAYADTFGTGDQTIHRLLGHPDPVQGDMQLECQLVTNGLYCGNLTGYRDPRAAGLRDGAAQWRLLLQVDSQDEAGMMWGDLGRLYYWMRHSDLLARDWELSWLILQCG